MSAIPDSWCSHQAGGQRIANVAAGWRSREFADSIWARSGCRVNSGNDKPGVDSLHRVAASLAYSRPVARPFTGLHYKPAIRDKCCQFISLAECLSVEEGPDSMGRINLIGTTFFYLPQGTLVTQGLTSVRLARPGTATEVGPITHITGAADATVNAIVFGTKRFADATGTARLPGMVNLSKLETEGMITSDCIFVVNLD
jgi:hypothetical protein